QPGARARIREAPRAHPGPVEPAVCSNRLGTERGATLRDRRASGSDQFVDQDVSVDDRGTEAMQQARHRALASADAPGQADPKSGHQTNRTMGGNRSPNSMTMKPAVAR